MNKSYLWSFGLLIIFASLPVFAGGFLQGEMTDFKHSVCLNDHKTCFSVTAETAESSELKALFVLNRVQADLQTAGHTEHIQADSAFIDFEMNQVVFNIEKNLVNSQRVINLANLTSRVIK